jgi:hypothetical protein
MAQKVVGLTETIAAASFRPVVSCTGEGIIRQDGIRSPAVSLARLRGYSNFLF